MERNWEKSNKVRLGNILIFILKYIFIFIILLIVNICESDLKIYQYNAPILSYELLQDFKLILYNLRKKQLFL